MSYDNDCRVRAGRRNRQQAAYYTVEEDDDGVLGLTVHEDGREAWHNHHAWMEESAVGLRAWQVLCHDFVAPPLPDRLPVVPGEWEVCDLCRGNGKVVNPSVDYNGISSQEFADDPDFAEDYFGGRFDIPCPECGGKRVTRSYVPAPGKLHDVTEAFLAVIDEALGFDAAYDAESAAERRMGA